MNLQNSRSDEGKGEYRLLIVAFRLEAFMISFQSFYVK